MTPPFTRLINAVFELRRALVAAGVDPTDMSVDLIDQNALFHLDTFLKINAPSGTFDTGVLGADKVTIYGVPFTARDKRRR